MIMSTTWIPRGVTEIEQQVNGISARLEAVSAISAGELGGWITGEPLADQGIEALPNLPALDLPDLQWRNFSLFVEFVAPDTIRILIAAPEQATAAADATWLGIVNSVNPDPPSISIRPSPDHTTLAGERFEVRIEHNPFTLAVYDRETDGTLLRTGERLRQATGLPMCPPVLIQDAAATLHLELGGDEQITGFGEQFGRTVHNGKHLVLRCADALGTATGYAYKPVPVWHSSAGYAALLNTGTTVTADVEHTRPGGMSIGVTDELLDLHLVVGDDPKQRLTAYTALTGRPEVPPPWAFGYWLGRCRYHSNTEMLTVARAAREHGIPLDVLHCDPDWLITDRLNCDFLWNTDRFGDRREFVEALRALGIRLSVWELPYLDPSSPRYPEALASGHLVCDTHGDVAHIVGTPSPDDRPRALVDLASESGRQWWQEMHEPFLDDGIEVFKTDFAEGLPDNARLGDGTPPAHAHNLYPLRYNDAVSEVIRRRTSRPPLVWARSGWAGSQRYPAQWGGDAESSSAGMRATLRGGLSFGVSAPGMWSHDVGGFFGSGLTAALYLRWTQFGALSPLMRAHGLSAREPWAWDERTLTIARDWIRLRYSLLPYLWQVAHEAQSHGWPMLRPLGLEFPDDPTATAIDGQFFLGNALLVAPVFDIEDGPVHRRCYLPEGVWTDLLTGDVFTGARWHTVEVPLERMPVFVRHGTILPRVEADGADTVDDLLTQPWIVHAYGEVAAKTTLVGFDRLPTDIHIQGHMVRSEGSQQIAATANLHHG